MRERTMRIDVYLSAEEARKLTSLCQLSGLSKSTFIRQSILGCEIKPRPPDSYKDLVRELSAIGNNINQVAHLANAQGGIVSSQVAELTDCMSKVWHLVQDRV